MKRNIGVTDKTIRLFLAFAIITLGFSYHSAMGFLGLIPLITGIVNFCPLYALTGTDTCKVESTQT